MEYLGTALGTGISRLEIGVGDSGVSAGIRLYRPRLGSANDNPGQLLGSPQPFYPRNLEPARNAEGGCVVNPYFVTSKE